MRINHNMLAMNTHRQMGTTGVNQSKSMEKLSSGLRINRAGDDAAGLAISEKMRGQIRGLNQASRNAQDGISMIQTAEGALNETQSILQRMRELAVQSANGTNIEEDRDALQNEITQLKAEVDRIAETTEFNKQTLLKGDGGTTLQGIGIAAASVGDLTGGADLSTTEATSTNTIGAAADATSSVVFNLNGQALTINFDAAGTSGEASHVGYDVTQNSATVNIDAAQTVDETATGLRDALQKVIDNNTVLKGNYVVSGTGADVIVSAVKGGAFEGAAGNIALSTSGGTDVFAGGTAGPANVGTTTAPAQATRTLTMPADAVVAAGLEGKGITINGTALEFYDATKGVYKGDAQGIDIGGVATKAALTNAIVAQAKIDGVTLTNVGDDLVVTATQGGKAGNSIGTSDGGIQEEFKAEFQIGANQGQKMEINMNDMRGNALGIKDVDISTTTGAQNAITTIEAALSKVSDERSKLGAFQNRLEHTIANLDTSAENLQASESRIRDVDMAKEMMEFTKNNILAQAAQSMLAQANQAPQGVLQLLR
ncbi:flagellin protein [Vallitalea pronyensis]|uniref:Flagellin n=1 Tax=Vallitalea pronyensis TaxID=1348613 RepID=A0A8J8MH65_9FIRM|nr:flagellin [Vallitalea pronyensis]QUI21456.1 flagellin protein [Vallitalea pronyensis]